MDLIKSREAANLLGDLCSEYQSNSTIDAQGYEKYEVKRGLRNPDGTGVLAGVTRIGSVQGYYVRDGERIPTEGKLYYRGIDVQELIDGFMSEDRFGFEETCYLLLFGALPSTERLSLFEHILDGYRIMPPRFTENMILPAPSKDIMNKLARSVLALYSYDDDPENNSYTAQMDKSLHLVAQCPMIVAHAFSAKQHYFHNDSLYLHGPQPGMSIAENFLYSVRRDNQFTKEEAKLLDLCLVLHADHGGGNNSAFTCRVLSSSGTDIYSAISAAIGSLKGPKHGGANMKVMEQFAGIEAAVKDWKDEDEVRACLQKHTRKELGDGSGLIYGIGHAVYSISDPRTIVLKQFARSVAEKKGMLDELNLLETVEHLAPQVLNEARNENSVYCANVDMYSGLVYKMLGIPEDLYTPLFAISRMVGWCAHRIEEICNPGKIIRPAYKSVVKNTSFIRLEDR